MSELARAELPKSMSYEWTELAYLELQAGNTAMIVFALLDRHGLPGPGGAVRELVDAPGRHPVGAACILGALIGVNSRTYGY